MADEWSKSDKVDPKYYDNVTIGFTDFVNFTENTRQTEPARLIQTLNEYFSSFDEICAQFNIEKLKTIGDSYMFCAGLPERNRFHALVSCLASLMFLKAVSVVNLTSIQQESEPWGMRIGLHTGPVMAGAVG